MNVFEIKKEIQRLESYIDRHAEENLGVVPEHAMKELDDFEEDLNAKLEAIYKIIKNKEASISALKDQKREFDTRIRVLDKSVEFLKSLVTFSLEDGEKFEHGIARFGWRESEQLLVNDENSVPDTFCTYERKVNKKDLKEYVKSGGEVEGVQIKKNNNLQVR
jgi:hypothetical protein